jgi:phage-related protein
MTSKFRVLFLDEATDFIESLDEKTKYKVFYNITKATKTNDNELFKKLDGEIWEFRTLYNKLHIRLFAFWDKQDKIDTVVISTHGIIKKTNKTPKTEIEKAEQLRKTYFERKNK